VANGLLYRQFAHAVELSVKKASRKIPVWGRPMPLHIFCKQSIAKKRGMGPYF